MKFIIKHETKGRMRIHLAQYRMTCKQADIFQYYLEKLENVTSVKVYEYTGDAAITFKGSRSELIRDIQNFHYDTVHVPENVIASSGRELNCQFRDRLTMRILLHFGRKFFLPRPVRIAYTVFKSAKYICHGLKCLSKRRLEVPVLDAAAITVSMVRGDFDTANSVMFLLGIGEILEDWTHKKSVSDLARSMSLNISSVWLLKDGQEILVSSETIQKGDEVVVHVGNVIPFDGDVIAGEAMVNQSSMTGESMPVKKENGGYVYAGTVVEEGELTVKVRAVSGNNRYEKIVAMIEDSEKLKSGLESKAEHLADRLVPYTLLGTGFVGLITRNATKALAVLMVDFSCALKLAMPIAVLSAIREAGSHYMTVKGGKYLEAMAEAATIVFDKTGTLTNARPTVKEVVTFDRRDPDEMLRIAACLEEHFPHSMAKSVVDAAKAKNLEHEEMHSKVDYIVAHGISSFIDGKKVIIGSYHFVFEDEKCQIPEEEMDIFESLSPEYSHLYLAIEQRLAAVICIQDPIRNEAASVISALKTAGIKKIVMMTGDSERTASAIARQVGIDEYYSEVLPEDKAGFVEKEKSLGHKVIMVGDGINDSPALSAANVGIAISDGAQIAREIADITISANDLNAIITLKKLSDRLMVRIQRNYRRIVVINTALILLGVGGALQPTTSALLHNMSTLIISLRSMKDLLDKKEE